MKDSKLNLDQLYSLMRSLLLAYTMMLQLNILHLDMRPESILKSQTEYKLSDYGFGQLIDKFTDRPLGRIYQSPQILNNKTYTSKADIWSFGVILYEAMYGVVPIVDNTDITFPEAIDNDDPIGNIINQAIQYDEDDRISWEELYSLAFVHEVLQINVECTNDPAYEQLQYQFRVTVAKCDLYLMFGLNSATKNTKLLSLAEFTKGVKKVAPKVNEHSILRLFQNIVGSGKQEISELDINMWLKRKQDRLIGSRGVIRPLKQDEQAQYNKYTAQDPKQIQWVVSLEPSQINYQFFTSKVKAVLMNIKGSMLKYNTQIDELYGKYDINKRGGLCKDSLDRIIKKIYPEGLDFVVASHVFQFLNQRQNGSISKVDFEYCLFKLDLESMKTSDNDQMLTRGSDGLLLCEVPHTDGYQLPFEVKRWTKHFLRQAKATQEVEYQQMDIEIKTVKCLYKTDGGITYLVFFDATLNFKLACCYLDELKIGFDEELKNKYGTQGVDYRSKVETLANSDSYRFQSFERFIKKKKQEFQDQNSTKNGERLKREINELQNIMQENIRLLVDRDDGLQKMNTKAKSLKEDSKMFKDKSSDLVWSLWLKKNSVWIIVVVFALIFLFLKFY